MIRAVLFDLDGTLTNTLADISTAMERALRLHGLPGWQVDDYRYLVGDGAKKLAERAVRDRQELAGSVQASYQAYYEKHALVETRPYAGIEALLEALSRRGMMLAVLSNKPDADTQNVVRHFFPSTPWAALRGQVEGVPVKPHPAGALWVAEQLRVLPSEVLYLGDTAVDMRCAVAAGMHPVGAAWGFRTEKELRENGAECIAATPSDVLKALEM